MVGVDPADDTEGDGDKDQSFWDWFNSRLDKLKGWFGEVVDGSKTSADEEVEKQG